MATCSRKTFWLLHSTEIGDLHLQNYLSTSFYLFIYILFLSPALSSPKLRPVRAGRKIEESDEDEDNIDDNEDEDDFDEDYKPDGSENEMETELLDYM